ncbi:Imm7 family immunity protein [Streptomyces sp. NPDC007172]|uniref:Imm7 family immunity protein n=1 Tax=Streptomyces sp. NPDC007172 TaxID=3364776 RepID=UPI00368ACB90
MNDLKDYGGRYWVESLDSLDWSTGEAVLRAHDGEWFVRADGLVNRRRDEAEELDALVVFIARRFPGAWGLLYERSDDLPEPPGPGAFRVRVLARGEVTTRLDPVLSPVTPIIED